MNPVLIYFREVPFKDNKFVLDFSDEKHVQPIEFKCNAVYYIATLDCKLKLKESILESEDIKKLYAKSKILDDKGPDHFCYIDYIDLVTPVQFKQPFSSSDQYINLEELPKILKITVTSINFGIPKKKKLKMEK